jgi:Asp/Glu/Hydantoin racemase
MSQTVQHDLAFLHTAQAHVERFTQLVSKAAPQLRVRHEVKPELLALAQDVGNSHPSVLSKVHAAMREAASSGAKIVVCTCSTIGGLAEQIGMHAAFQCQRIDRAMADTAVLTGPRILVVVALPSTLRATTDLLRQSANSLGRDLSLQTLEVVGAWENFMRHDYAAYAKCVADSVRQHEKNYDVVVLAQASMQDAVEQLAELGKPVLASPQLGVERALLCFK